MQKDIFARKEIQDILDKAGIKYKVDQNLNLHFSTERDRVNAIAVLKDNLIL